MHHLTLITGNNDKAQELRRLLGFDMSHQSISLPEIQHSDVAVVAVTKAEAAYEILGRPVLVDDTGLYVNAWNNLPGALIAWFIDNVGNEGLLRMLKDWSDRSAKVATALGYCDKNGTQVFVGEVFGQIAESPRGKKGFGYDTIFIPDGQNKTFAQMSASQKDCHSMRAIAAQQLSLYLNERN